jgi:trans-aconitate 2-methyltransferase
MRTDTWDPVQYALFAAERRRPFDDLVALVTPVPGGRVVDLGCGQGSLTVDLHRHVRAASTVGVDASSAMLAEAAAHAGDGVTFEPGDLTTWTPPEPVDVVFANASMHWAHDHPALLARLARELRPDGQLAFQVPANADHPAHTIAAELAEERGLDVVGASRNVLAPETYAAVLHSLGLVDELVRLQVYGFELPSGADVVDWTKGTLLTGYEAQLPPDAYQDFEAEYRRRVTETLGAGPYYFAFKRILAHARLP